MPTSPCWQCLLQREPGGCVWQWVRDTRDTEPSLCREAGADPLWSPSAAEGQGPCLGNGSPGNPFVSSGVLRHLCCVHAMAQAQAWRALNSVTVTLLPVPGGG